MNQPLTLKGGPNGQPLPNPSGFGFTWKPLEKLLKEQRRIHDEAQENNYERIQLQEQVAQMERSAVADLAEAIRAGEDEPDGTDLEKARRDLERVEKRGEALALALKRINAEITATVTKHRDEWGAEVRERVAKRAEAVEEAVRSLRQAQQDLATIGGLLDYIDRPETGYAAKATPFVVSTFSGEVKVAEALDAIGEDAQRQALSPEEETRARWTSIGAVTG